MKKAILIFFIGNIRGEVDKTKEQKIKLKDKEEPIKYTPNNETTVRKLEAEKPKPVNAFLLLQAKLDEILKARCGVDAKLQAKLDEELTARCAVNAKNLLNGVTQDQLEKMPDADLVQAFYSSLFMSIVKSEPVFFNTKILLVILTFLGMYFHAANYIYLMTLNCVLALGAVWFLDYLIIKKAKIPKLQKLNKYFYHRMKSMPKSFYKQYTKDEMQQALKLFTKQSPGVKLQIENIIIITFFMQAVIMFVDQPLYLNLLVAACNALISYFLRDFFSKENAPWLCFPWLYSAYILVTAKNHSPSANDIQIFSILSLFIAVGTLNNLRHVEKDIAQSMRILYAHQKAPQAAKKSQDVVPKVKDAKISIEV